jgi:hypothetical protein
VSLSNEFKVCAVGPVHLMETYRGFVVIAAFIRILDSVWS